MFQKPTWCGSRHAVQAHVDPDVLTVLLGRYEDLLSIEMIDDVREKFTELFPLPIEFTWAASDAPQEHA